MVALIDYAYRGKTVRLPAGTILNPEDMCDNNHEKELPLPENFVKVDEFNTNEGNEVRVNGEVIDGVSVHTIVKVLEAANCPHAVESFEFYELIDSNEYPEYHERDPDNSA